MHFIESTEKLKWKKSQQLAKKSVASKNNHCVTYGLAINSLYIQWNFSAFQCLNLNIFLNFFLLFYFKLPTLYYIVILCFCSCFNIWMDLQLFSSLTLTKRNDKIGYNPYIPLLSFRIIKFCWNSIRKRLLDLSNIKRLFIYYAQYFVPNKR